MVDARSPDAALLLAPYLGAGQTAVVLGSSGAGKSTLTNTLIGAAVQDTGACASTTAAASARPRRARCTACPAAPA